MTTYPPIKQEDHRYLASRFIESSGAQRDNFLFLSADQIASLDFVSDVPVLIFDITNNQYVYYFRGTSAVIGGGGGGGSHNSLTGLQGGAPSEFYHLSAAQYASLASGNFQGNWNASANSPAIPAASSANKDQFYRVATAGTASIDGNSHWNVGDWIWSTGSVWIRLASGGSDTRDFIPIASNGQTVFALSALPENINSSKLYINGARQQFGIDYTIAGTVLTWLNTSFTLRTSDVLEVFY